MIIKKAYGRIEMYQVYFASSKLRPYNSSLLCYVEYRIVIDRAIMLPDCSVLQMKQNCRSCPTDNIRHIYKTHMQW